VYHQMAELKPPNEYRLFNFDFVDVNFDDEYRCQIVFKMFLEIDVIDKFKVSIEVRQPHALIVRLLRSLLPARMLRAGIVFGGVSVSLCVCPQKISKTTCRKSM